MGDRRVCLDLFSGLGGFSAAFEESTDWEVVTVDIEERFDPDIQADVLDLRPSDLPDADVVLASPPCTYFSTVRLRWGRSFTPDGEPLTPEAKESVAIVYHTLGLIHAINPDWWFMENPQGYLRHVIGDPEGTVDYCRYGHHTKKPTDLWGDHPPIDYLRCDHQTHTRENATDFELGPSDSSERAKVPYELSKAILDAVESAYENPPPEQSDLEAYA